MKILGTPRGKRTVLRKRRATKRRHINKDGRITESTDPIRVVTVFAEHIKKMFSYLVESHTKQIFRFF